MSFTPYWIDNLPIEEYHRIKDYDSSSGLKLFHQESPDVYEDRYIKGNHKKPSDSMRVSSLVHHAILEPDDFMKRYEVMPKFTGVGSVAKRNKWKDDNRYKVIVKENEKKIIEGTYQGIMRHKRAAMLLNGSKFERSGFYIDPLTGIRCRIRYDAYNPEFKVLIDIKAVKSIKDYKFSQAIRDYRWDLSMAMYGQGMLEIDGKEPEQYVFIAVEKEAPFRCAVYELSERSLAVGRNDYFSALRMLKACRESGKYPSYQESQKAIDLPLSFLKEREA